MDFEKFKKITKKYPDININTLFFEDILFHFNISTTSKELLQKYGKFSFQTLKKFYTMLYLGKEYRFLVLDSESILYRQYDINCLFSDFFQKPFISGTSLLNRTLDFMVRGVKTNTSDILKKETNTWFLENFIWFYDFNILTDLFNKYGSPIEMVEFIHKNKIISSFNEIFEIDLYQTYIYQNLKKYNYHYIDLENILNNYSDNCEYRRKHQQMFNGSCGMFEHVMLFLNKNNVDELANILKKLNFNIIRCDKTTVSNYLFQKQFLDIVQPVILAASQDHYFGVKHNIQQLLIICSNLRNIQKLQKHLKAFFSPLAKLIIWILEPINILKYLVKTCSSLLLNIIKLKFK